MQQCYTFLMFTYVFSNLKKAAEKIRLNPQLAYTFVIALLITGAFVFTTQRFISIATDAQERLANVRIGSLQDAFVSFASDRFADTNYLKTNETIRSFRVIVKKTVVNEASTTIPNAYVVVASNNLEEINKIDEQAGFLYTLSSSDPEHSITSVIDGGGERLFNTTRAITDNSGNIVAVVYTTQTLSLADTVIEKNINNSIVILTVILILIMFLFLRHSRIVDYMGLYKKLKEVDQLKDDFVSMASHELKTPLTIIRGYVSMIAEARDLSSETKDSLDKITTATKDLDSLVIDILDVSRIEQGRLSFNLQKLNPKDIVSAVTTSFVVAAKEKNLTVTFDESKVSDSQFISADPERLKQVLVNLIGNAVKYTPRGEVTVRQYVEKGRLYIRISDTGIGMTAEEKERLFEKFYRIKTKETEDIRGTGLGLWITAKIIKEMNGKIDVESIKGVGSHFVVYFPLVD
jgi:signal transduction histidine kinase